MGGALLVAVILAAGAAGIAIWAARLPASRNAVVDRLTGGPPAAAGAPPAAALSGLPAPQSAVGIHREGQDTGARSSVRRSAPRRP